MMPPIICRWSLRFRPRRYSKRPVANMEALVSRYGAVASGFSSCANGRSLLYRYCQYPGTCKYFRFSFAKATSAKGKAKGKAMQKMYMIILIMLFVIGCSKGPDSARLQKDIQQKLDNQFQTQLFAIESFSRKGQLSLSGLQYPPKTSD